MSETLLSISAPSGSGGHEYIYFTQQFAREVRRVLRRNIWKDRGTNVEQMFPLVIIVGEVKEDMCT